MKVLAIHLTSPCSSEANVLGNLLKHLAGGLRVKLVVNRLALDSARSFFRPLAAMPGVEICGVDVGLPLEPQAPRPLLSRVAGRLHHLLAREAVVRAAERYEPDLVYTSQQRFDCRAGEMAARRLGVPHAVHLHYTPCRWLGREALERLVTCDRVIAVSRFIGRLAEAHGVRRSRVAVLPNSIETTPPEAVCAPVPRRPGRLTVGQIGRMAPGKGFADTIVAFASLHRTMPRAELLLVGDGSERPRLQAMVRQLGLERAVRFAGWQPDPTPCLRTMDVFINPARDEPFGLVALEAAAAGIPVLAYDEGGMAEIVKHGETGWLATPGSLGDLSRGLVALATDERLRADLGRAGRLRAARDFDPAVAGRAFSTILAGTVQGAVLPSRAAVAAEWSSAF